MTRVWDDEARARFEAGYAPRLVLAGAVFFAVVTLLSLGATRLFVGQWWLGSNATATVFAAVTLVALTLPFVTATRLGTTDGPPRIYCVQSTFQTAWLFLLAWGTHPATGIVLAMLLLSAVVNDTRYFHDASASQRLYALTFPVLLLCLLGLDVTTGQGILARFSADALDVQVRVVGGLAVSGVALFVVRQVGGQWRTLDLQAKATAVLQRELAVARAEGAAVRQASEFMEFGISAGRFTHDVASPLSTLSFCVEHLRADSAMNPETIELLADAVATLRVQQDTLARAIRAPEEKQARPCAALLAEAIAHARQTGAKLAGRPDFPVELDIDTSEVLASPQHVGAIADLISNGVRHSARGVHISGTRKGELYAVSIRDYGLSGDAQSRALRAVQARLDAAPDNSAMGAHGGLGIGLAIARLTALRHGGSLSVQRPDGPGLCLVLTLPAAQENLR